MYNNSFFMVVEDADHINVVKLKTHVVEAEAEVSGGLVKGTQSIEGFYPTPL